MSTYASEKHVNGTRRVALPNGTRFTCAVKRRQVQAPVGGLMI